MKCMHTMPFGAELRSDGVRFRLLAPAPSRVDLVLEPGDASERIELPMKRTDDGFFELLSSAARAGSRYRYRIDGGLEVPDPASRSNPDDPSGPSLVVDPSAFDWTDAGWSGRPWHETVIYELHVGTFTRDGTFAAAIERLPYLAALGVTAIELMPIADFAGGRGWGYDGVLPFAPDASYGTPEDLKRLIDAAHALRLMVFLDVVYNHFGPEGNYLHAYAPSFFSERHHTLWGPAVNFDGEGSAPVRNFFVHNTLYWLEEYRFDGLRFDAVNTIRDASEPHILEDIAAAAHAGPGRTRMIHLVLENDNNAAHYLRPLNGTLYRAQWNDDAHHALHALATGERDGYYADYTPRAVEHLARCLAEGFDYQGQPSAFRRGRKRGEESAGLPPAAFVDFLQNHDQVGNRAFGERITALAPQDAVRCLTAILLLSPHMPLLFMGQEYGAATPFQFFCDFGPQLGAAVAKGRRAEFARFAAFASEADRARIPDPNDPATFARSKLDWGELDAAQHAAWHDYHRALLALRQRRIVPLLPHLKGYCGKARVLADTALEAVWAGDQGQRLTLIANIGEAEVDAPSTPVGDRIFATSDVIPAKAGIQVDTKSRRSNLGPGLRRGDPHPYGKLPPWSVYWYARTP